jgi:hypothetical protein
MKFKIFTFLFTACLALFFCSCAKQQLAQPEQPKVIELTIGGNTTEPLEFIYKGIVIGETKEAGQIIVKSLISFDGKDTELKIRKKGATDILQSRVIAPSPFAQTMNFYYDGSKIYNNTISYQIKGYAITGDLEFLLDDKIILEGNSVIEHTFNVNIDNGTTREIKVRKKGGSEILISKAVTSSSALQSLKFFFDGTKIVDNVKLNPPVNPANMAVSAKFETTLPDLFKGVDMDLVFFVYNTTTSEAVKTSPEIRVALPANGTFSSIFELPPLPNLTEYVYTFDIYEKGTNIIPYNTESVPTKPAKSSLGVGSYGTPISSEAGGSKLWIIKDVMYRVNFPAAKRGTYFSGSVTDLTQYFK